MKPQTPKCRPLIPDPTWTSERDLGIWLALGMLALKISRASVTRAGCATHVPSWPLSTSLCLSVLTCRLRVFRVWGTRTCGGLIPLKNPATEGLVEQYVGRRGRCPPASACWS